jgi:hypothetical protein
VAGDPLALVERAVERLAHKRRRGAVYRHAVVFLDVDRAGEAPERAQRARSLAQEQRMLLVWQRPNLEGMLLRHLNGCQHLQPPAAQSLVELQRRWPEYDKSGISAEKLARRIGYPEILQATAVEQELGEFLHLVRLL